MPPLDSATINAILQKQGMPNTTENLNRIAQFAAVAPDMLEKYLGRGTDVSRMGGANGTNAAIDASIAQTDPRLAQLAGPNPYSAKLDPDTGMTNIGPGLVKGPAEPRTGNGVPGGRVTVGQPQKAAPPGGSPSRQGEYGPGPTPPVNPLDPHVTAAGGEGSGWLFEMLVPILGPAMAAVVARGRAGLTAGPKVGAPPAGMTEVPNVPPRAGTAPASQAAGKRAGGSVPPTPPPTSEYGAPQAAPAQRGSVPPSGAPTQMQPGDLGADRVAPGPGQTEADVARIRAEIQAENDALRLQEQMKQRAKPPAIPKKTPRVTIPGRP